MATVHVEKHVARSSHVATKGVGLNRPGDRMGTARNVVPRRCVRTQVSQKGRPGR